VRYICITNPTNLLIMTSQQHFRLAPPQNVYESYKAIRNSDLISKKQLDEGTIKELQKSLNESQPKSENEQMSRSFVQYLYRKNPTNFCRFLMRSRLSHLILWTEAKCIVRHFGLQGVVYVRWNDDAYECSMHKNASNNTQGDVGEVHEYDRPVRTNENYSSRNGRSTRGGRESGFNSRNTTRDVNSNSSKFKESSDSESADVDAEAASQPTSA